MAITQTQQRWTAGETVKVGFMTGLLVVAVVPTPGDAAPDAYVLSRNDQFYSFVPHNGLMKISLVEAREMVAEAKVHAERIAAAALAKAAESARHIEAINDLMFG
jgi:hypothetical protein